MAGTVVADQLEAASTSTLVLKNGVANTPPTIQDSAGTEIGTFDRYGQEILSCIEYRDGVLYWRNDRNFKVKAGDKVGAKVFDYLRFKLFGKTFANHRAIYFIHHKKWPEVVDHIDRNTENNRIENLRAATKSDNGANSKPHRDRKAKGSYKLNTGRYMSVIQKDGKREYLGVFDTAKEAQNAYALAATRVHGEFACASLGGA